MKTYSAKWLPVEGEAKEGEFCLIEDDDGVKIGYLPLQKKHQQEGTLKITKVKLFLCSRDIQVGDKIMACQTKDHFKNGDYNIEMVVLSEDTEHTWKVRQESWSDAVSINMPKNYCIKVIGEISLGAIWIREGDEFGEEEIKRDILIKDYFDEDDYTEYNHIYPKGNEVYKVGIESDLVKEYPIKIQCPTCKQYH